jgi:drug/metabolite transporter (DMT)-like permease
MHHRPAYVLLLATMLFWGGNAVAGKLAVGHVSPMLLTTARWGLACVVLAAFCWRQLDVDWPVVRKRLGLLAMLGTAGFAVFNVALYTAVLYTSAINVSIEQAGMPALIFLANFVLFRQRATAAQLAGLVISMVGIALTASHGDLTRLLELDVNFGDALMLLAVIVYAGYTVALRFKPPIRWQSLMIVMTGAAFLSSLPFLAGEFALGTAILPDTLGWLIIAYTVIFPSILAQVFYIRSVELIGANRAGLFINLLPIFGTLLSIAILGETFHLYHAVALVTVLGGIWLAEHSGRKMR